MEKKNFSSWTKLSPIEIYEIHKKMWNWSEDAENNYEGGIVDKKKIDLLLLSLLRKISAVKAIEVMNQISQTLGLSDLSDFCTQQKFSGLLGVNQVANMTLSGLFFHSNTKNNFSNYFGGIKIDYDRKLKLGLMLSEHDEIQEELDRVSDNTKSGIRLRVKMVASCTKNKKYLNLVMQRHGECIKEELHLVSNPVILGLNWCNIDYKSKDKTFNLYQISKDKKDGGLFQYLCIVLFSLKF